MIDGDRLEGDFLGLGILLICFFPDTGDNYKCLSKGYEFAITFLGHFS